MYCPRCGKLMELTYSEGFSLENSMTCEEYCECKCGISYEYSYGAEHFLNEKGDEYKVE